MNSRALPYILITPASVFLLVLFVIPLVQTLGLAFHQNGAWSLGNFATMAGDLDFSDAIANTFKLVLVAVPLQIICAIGMAMMLARIRRGRDLILWIWTIPLGISDLAAGLVWLAILNDQGYLNSLLFHLGIISAPHAWLTYETPAALFAAVAIAEIWRATAIVLLIIVAGVQVLPKEYGEAAAVFGASPWRCFLRVTLPLLKNSIQTALILRTVLAFEAFAVVMALGGRNFPVIISQAFSYQQDNNSGVAACFAVIIMAVSILATLFYLVALRTPQAQR